MAAGFLVVTCAVAEPQPDPAELPRIPPRSPAEARDAFVIRDGFRVELSAAEPLVVDPVAIAFDAAGAMFVVEMRGYPERREEALGRIKRLVDTDHDGCFDTATTFADGLQWPTGVVCWRGGVFVTASPDILLLRDTDGDGVADGKEVVFTGFGAGQPRLNMQALVNGLQWGPDGRIYGSTARNGGRVGPPGTPPGARMDLRGADFSFHPGTRDLRRESGTAQYGLAFDDFGRRYLCSNSRHLIAVMYSWPWNDMKGLPHPLVDIPADGGAAEVFRISRVEPWRVVRTRWRVQGLVKGPVEGGGRAAGYFTSASGLAVYRGDAFPGEYRGNVFVGDVGSNLVHRKVIEFPEDRVQPVARRAPGGEKREFLASTDNWFRPVQCANGPDGTLYVVDMYRETIEHPWSIPEGIKTHLDLYSGNDRGRIWRVVPDGFERPPIVNLERLTTAQLVETLQSGNGWVRDTASRLLAARNDLAAAQVLPLVTARGLHDERTRVAALRLYARAKPIDPGLGAQLLLDPSAAVRGEVVRRLAISRHDLLNRIASDPDPRVRFELALRVLDPDSGADGGTLAELLRGSGDDPWIVQTTVAAAKVHGLLGILIAGQDDLAMVVKLVQAAGVMKPPEESVRWLPKAREVLGDQNADAALRDAAMWLIGIDPATTPAEFWAWIDEMDPRLAAVAASALARRPAAVWEAGVALRWKKLTPALREILLPGMSSGAIVAALENGAIRPNEIGFQRRRQLRKDRDPGVRAKAVTLLGKELVRTREEAARHYRPALLLDGDAAAGQSVFAERCALCHEAKEGTAPVGPGLATLRNKGAPLLLENIIAPDLETAPQYVLWEVAMNDGERMAGMIAEEREAEFVLIRVDGSRIVISRDGVQRLTNLNRSLMPAGLEAGLSLQEMANLLAFLTRGVEAE